jgi:hypothetical protein
VVIKNSKMKKVEDILISEMQKCGNIFGDKLITEAQAKGCLMIAIDLVIDSLENKDDVNWWKDFQKQVNNRNTTIII